MPEILPADTIEQVLNTEWNSTTVAEPTFVEVGGDGIAVRQNFRSQDLVVLRVDTSAMEERPIGNWTYGHRTTKILLELYTQVNRQRLYDLMAEIRRICHNRMHTVTGYQRIQFINFNELTSEQAQMWAGRILLELINNAILLET